MRNYGRLSIVILASIGAVGLGFGIAVLLDVHTADPAVQGAMVGAIAGIAGGLVGAAIGAWASRDVADRTIADAREARREARRDAQQAAFLQERRVAIVGALASGEAAVIEAKRVAQQVDSPDSPKPRPDLLEAFRKAWIDLTLLAPDVVSSGPGVAYSAATKEVAAGYGNFAYLQLADAAAGHDLSPLPRSLTEAEAELDRALAAFLVVSMVHLGVTDYARPPDDSRV